MSVRLYTLGRLALERDGAEVSGDAAQPRRLALMALLAAAPDGLTRDKVIGFLWAEQRSARAILNESVFVLRSVLGKPAIRTVGEILRLDPLEVWTDVRVFQERMVAGALHEAVELYRGPFLDGFYVRGTAEFEQWVGREQDRLRREYGRALEALAERAAAAGAAASAAEWWRRLAEHEEFSVRVAFRYVEALVQAGEPVLALRYAAAFTERMTKEMGVEPEGSVLEHARALASKAPPPAGSARFRAEPADGAWPATVGAEPLPAGDALEGLAPELEVVRPIGEGSVARVYLARERALGRVVAVKVLAPVLARDGVARARFEREARAAASIQHPNVAPVYRTGQLPGGVPYLVMPYFYGGSLESRLKAAGPLSPEEGQRYLGQLAAGLAAAHRLGIVHRDVRPANILYDRETHRVVLIDFGIAAVLDGSQLTLPGQRLGVPAYASPEQLRGDVAVTDRADVYSLGIVAFEMLAGRLPFDARTAAGMMRAHTLEVPPALAEVRPEAGAGLGELIARCLQKRPEERPSAADVAEAMNR